MTQPAVSLAIKELEQYYGVHCLTESADDCKSPMQVTFSSICDTYIRLVFRYGTGLRDWDSKGVLRIGASITIGSQFYRTM